ncbi:MAG: hypothetical protein QOG90_1681 [Actinomycetota bacterium]|jgi:uncharacterized membrane protein YjdF
MIRRHPALAVVLAIALVGFGALGAANGAKLTVPYLVIVGGAAVAVGYADGRRPLSRVALVGLALWGVGHLAGGIVEISHHRILYNALLPGRIHLDNVVHFVGFGSAGLAFWEWLGLPTSPAASWFIVWVAAMGIGAFNEVVEFAATHLLAATQVGGYQNTGRDLVANMLGGATAGVIAARRVGVPTTGR